MPSNTACGDGSVLKNGICVNDIAKQESEKGVFEDLLWKHCLQGYSVNAWGKAYQNYERIDLLSFL